jgi:hypothetical protein
MKRFWHWLNCYRSFRVIYPDGKRTYRLSHVEAKNLRAIFGGKLIFDPA